MSLQVKKNIDYVSTRKVCSGNLHVAGGGGMVVQILKHYFKWIEVFSFVLFLSSCRLLVQNNLYVFSLGCSEACLFWVTEQWGLHVTKQTFPGVGIQMCSGAAELGHAQHAGVSLLWSAIQSWSYKDGKTSENASSYRNLTAVRFIHVFKCLFLYTQFRLFSFNPAKIKAKMKGICTFLENMAISEVKKLYTPSSKLGVSEAYGTDALPRVYFSL